MSAVFADNGQALLVGVALDGVGDIGKTSIGHGLGNAEFKAGQSAVDKMLSFRAYCTDTNGKSAVAIVAVE